MNVQLAEWPYDTFDGRNKQIINGVQDGICWALIGVTVLGVGSFVNGYVKIPEGHPWRELDYDDVPVDVHGGLTYGGYHSPEGTFGGATIPAVNRDPEDVGYWIGFDTGHGFDQWPEEELAGMGLDPHPTIEGHPLMTLTRLPQYDQNWTYQRVLDEVLSLARQVKEAS